MSTKTDKKPTKLLEEKQARIKQISDLLAFYDRYLYGEKKSVDQCAKLLQGKGHKTHGIRIGTLARKVCKFYLNAELVGGRHHSGREIYNSDEWYRQQD